MSGARQVQAAGGGQPLLDAAWLEVLHVLAVNGIGFHSLGITFDQGRGWGVTAVFAAVDHLQRAGAALGLDLTGGSSRSGLHRTGTVAGLPVTCLCWTGRHKTGGQATAPAASGQARPRGYVNAPAPDAQPDLLDLLAVTS